MNRVSDQRDGSPVSGAWERRDERTIRNEPGRKFACSENLDTPIDRGLKRLEAMGELGNTTIFYTAAHGIAIGRHGLQGKLNLYQHSWRLPFVVKGPVIRPGSRAEGNLYLPDALATLCDLAGVPAPATGEGVSFRPFLEGRRPAARHPLRRLLRRTVAGHARGEARRWEADRIRGVRRPCARVAALRPEG